MLESQLKAWDSKEVTISYEYYRDGYKIDLAKEYQELREDIKAQGFEIREECNYIEILGTCQGVWLRPTSPYTGTFKSKSKEFIVGDRHCEYPKKDNLSQNIYNSFTKKVEDKNLTIYTTFKLS